MTRGKMKEEKGLVPNESGMYCTYNRVLLLPDPVSDTAGKDGIIVKPDELKERDEYAQIKGTVIDVGGNAFEGWKGVIPSIGDRVIYMKYSGFRFENEKTWKTYQMVDHEDVVGVLIE